MKKLNKKAKTVSQVTSSIECKMNKNSKSRGRVTHLKFAEHTKMTQAVYCKSLLGGGSVTLYAADEHKEEIKKIYSELNKTVFFADVDIMPQNETVCEFHFNKAHAHAEFVIQKPGNNTQNNVLNVLKSYEACEDMTATVYLNMCEIGSTAVYEILKQNGFYYSGIKPLSRAGEYMILSKTSGCRENFSDICLPENKKDFISCVRRQSINCEVQA